MSGYYLFQNLICVDVGCSEPVFYKQQTIETEIYLHVFQFRSDLQTEGRTNFCRKLKSNR